MSVVSSTPFPMALLFSGTTTAMHKRSQKFGRRPLARLLFPTTRTMDLKVPIGSNCTAKANPFPRLNFTCL
ncbi:hypothetical protein STEG23_034246 [Scotinomys teguina]